MGASKRRPPEILKFDKKNVPHTGPVMNPIQYTHIIVCTHAAIYDFISALFLFMLMV